MKKKNIYNQSMKNITVLFGVILLALFIILVLLRITLDYANGTAFDIRELLDTMIGSIIGVFFPLLIFNVFYEYFVRIYSAHEVSEKITETIMANKEVIDSFEINTKKAFIKTTMQSIMETEKGDVVYEMIAPYLRSELNLRKEYRYTIMLGEFNPAKHSSWSDYIDIAKYNLVQESLTYTKIFTDYYTTNKEYINIGFFLDEKTVDNAFKNNNFIFRENLYVSAEDFADIKAKAAEFISNYMKLKLHINECCIDLQAVEVSEAGISVTYKIPSQIKMDTARIDITFSMPQLKSKNSFLIVICEPTYKPKIKFIYPRETYKISTIPFFDESFVDSGIAEIDGIKEYELNNWIMPRSGVVIMWYEI